jgi:RecA-family ATPase
MDPLDKARKYLAKMPPAISGQGGHNAAYNVAVVLAHGLCLDWTTAMMLLQEYNKTCSPPWNDRELSHKLKDAFERPHDRPRGFLLSNTTPSKVAGSGRFRFDPLDCKIDESGNKHTTKDLLLAAFKPDECICITNEAGEDEDGRFFPAAKGTFQTTTAWIEKHFGEGDFIFDGKPQGAWIRINPFHQDDFSGKDDAVAVYRHVLIEFDDKPKHEQEQILRQSNLPITALIDSGGKSVHGWIRVDAENFDEWKQRRDAIYEYLTDYNPDPQNKNPSRWSRLGGIARGQKVQSIIALNVGSENWNRWIDWRNDSEIPDEMQEEMLRTFDRNNDPNNVLGDRWICKGGSLMLVGQSGAGKSSLMMQACITWATGREFFGIKTIKPLRTIVIQAENDLGDMAEAYQDTMKALQMADEDIAKIRDNVRWYREAVKTGQDFADQARKLIAKHKADLIFIDPLLAFAGCDISAQKDASTFLRNIIQPILNETGVIWIFVHHMGKPKAKSDTDGHTVNDMAYSGLGSSELVNWAREVAVLKRDDQKLPIFSLTLTKRGKRAGMTDMKGTRASSIQMRHSEAGIAWERYAPMMKLHDTSGLFDAIVKEWQNRAPAKVGRIVQDLQDAYQLDPKEAHQIKQQMIDQKVLIYDAKSGGWRGSKYSKE